ncbi:class I SAM-dependent RNA methyltransferase [Corynebacterium sp. zg254]|uniref:Class I SAM-dependent RNA methyltransferase n=2 Tax=Corynebacteriaceae TaxID=1653 RepID=A0ABQ6VGX9_9CORY|nr:class I SAM-dependent RNA methyltransferase [Corynebacterium zhongnanshanii]MCR5913458.1 class I SAM-dependent RNA methyltransferase [Corynebacterium sp. zg254]
MVNASQDTLVVDTDNPAHGGTTVARHNGQVIFVAGALPGERGVRVELDPQSKKKSFRTGRAVSIEHPSPHRVAHRCEAAARGAGCCDLDIVDSLGSLEFKTRVVRDQLERIGRLDVASLENAGRWHSTALHPSTGWRKKVRLGVDRKGRIGTRVRGSRDIIPLAEAVCAQLHPTLVTGLADQLERLQAAETFTPGADLVVAVGDDATEDTPAPARSIIEVSDAQRTNPRRQARTKRRGSGGRHRSRAAATRRVLEGPQSIERHVRVGTEDLVWEIPGDSFWQGHENATQYYADWIARHIPRVESTSVNETAVAWDLYGGAGVFGAVLSDIVPCGVVEVVDIASAATRSGEQALGRLVADGRVRFTPGDVATVVPTLCGADVDHELVAAVLDPPRGGAGARVIEAIAAAHPRHVVHIGCDPATAARDLRAWEEQGYEVRDLEVVDAFALTHHVELLAYLTPKVTERGPRD